MRRKCCHLLIALAVVIIVTLSVSAAYVKYTENVENSFTPAAPITPSIVETFDPAQENVKKDVKINVGETGYPVYVRVKLVITWKRDTDETSTLSDGTTTVVTPAGTVYYKTPSEGSEIENTNPTKYVGDYILALNLSDDGWVKIGDYYYYTKPVKSGGETDILINSCYPVDKAPADGYILSVEIITQTVQAIGTTDVSETPAYQDAWGITNSFPEPSEETTEETTN